ncbi:MAG: endonuclease domain-containing protein [Cyclobacteriaceae bacterium]|nr:endonuclease domain-containing protein [Cyclobacteriaceae bacterium]
MRNNMTLSEVLLWNELKGKRVLGYDFDRQRPIDNYIVDFYCKELFLVIEVDGDSHYHDDAPIKDAIRQKKIESFGVHFLRFHEIDVKQNINYVVNTIYDWISDNKDKTHP